MFWHGHRAEKIHGPIELALSKNHNWGAPVGQHWKKRCTLDLLNIIIFIYHYLKQKVC